MPELVFKCIEIRLKLKWAKFKLNASLSMLKIWQSFGIALQDRIGLPKKMSNVEFKCNSPNVIVNNNVYINCNIHYFLGGLVSRLTKLQYNDTFEMALYNKSFFMFNQDKASLSLFLFPFRFQNFLPSLKISPDSSCKLALSLDSWICETSGPT